MKNKKSFVICLIISLIVTLITFQTDKIFFKYKLNDILSIVKVLEYKIILFLIITLLLNILMNIIKRKLYKTLFFKHTVIYFSIMMFFLLLTYPGVWRNDDIGILLYAIDLKLESWHHILTSIFYILSLMLCPIPAGVVIAQNIIISIIVGYIISSIEKELKPKKTGYLFLLYIPFLLPAVIDNNLYPLRPILYSYLFVLMTFLFIKIFYDKKISIYQLLVLIISSCISIFYRSEGIVVLPFIFLLFIILYNKKIINIKKLLISFISIIALFLGVNELNNFYLDIQYNNSYKYTVSFGFIKEAINLASDYDLKNFDKVIDIEKIKTNPNLWVGKYRRSNYTKEDVDLYLKSYIKTSIKHLDKYLLSRIKIYIKTSGFVKDYYTSIFNSAEMYDEKPYFYYDLYTKDQVNCTFKPINKDLRKFTINLLEGKNNENETNIIFHLFWNHSIPILAIFIVAILLLINKKWYYLFVILTILVKLGTIFMTAPDSYFMYYFSEYITGYLIICIMIYKKLVTN